MAQLQIYANNETTGSSFHCSSSWTGTGSSFSYGPTIGYQTKYYDLSVIPAGSRSITLTVYARIGARFGARSGTAHGYPKANGVSFEKVAGSNDAYLYKADITFEDTLATTRVAFAFKANGYKSDTGNGQGSQSFDDVYLVADFTPPCSDWRLDRLEYYAEEYVTGYVVETADNISCYHRIDIECGNQKTSQLLWPTHGSPHVSNTFEIEIPLNWITEYPTTMSFPAAVTLTTLEADGITVLGVSEPIEIIVKVPDSLRPQGGIIEITGHDMLGRMYVQGVSSITVRGYGWGGDAYGSTVTSVRLEGGKEPIVLDAIKLATATEIVIDSMLLDMAGIYTFDMIVTDSRGNTAHAEYIEWGVGPSECMVEVVPYSPISIRSTAQARCTAAGVPDPSGTNAYIRIAYDYTPLSSSGQSNIPSLSLEYRSSSGSVIGGPVSKASYNSGDFWLFSRSDIVIDESFELTIVISDGLSTATATRTISSAYSYMRWEPQNNAIGFGCYPTGQKRVQIADDWDLIAKNIYVGGTSLETVINNSSSSNIVASATTPNNPTVGMIWLDIS